MILTDIHCHILPGVDDGASNGRIAITMLEQLYKEGVRRIIVTPHYRVGMFEPSVSDIEHRYILLKKYAAGIGRDGIEVYLGCEYHRDDEMIANLKKGKRPTMAGSRYVLVEFSVMDSYARIRGAVYELVSAGFIPIVAHVERYPVMVKDPEYIRDLIDLGALIQVNADSMLGVHDRRMKRFCKKLMKREEIHFIASDAHDLEERPSRLRKCADYVERKWGKEKAEEIFVRNPSRILGEMGEKSDR